MIYVYLVWELMLENVIFLVYVLGWVYLVSGYNLIVLLGIGIILFFIFRCVLIKY